MTAGQPTTDAIFEMRGIVKRFPGVLALDRVGFACRAGEVHALVGENGAGKSTLIKVLSGAYRPDEGEIFIKGAPVRFDHPSQSLRAGVSVIYQEFSLLPDRTVAENIFLGHEPLTRWGLLDQQRMRAETQRALEVFGRLHRVSPDRRVGDLDVAEQQLVEIAKAVALDAKVVVMDEPTAALNEQECEVLFELVDALRRQGRAIVYITHRMREIARLADRVTVLKDGQVTAEYDHAPEPGAIVRAMVGRDIGDFYPPPAAPEEVGEVVLRVEGGGNDALSDIDLTLRAGEIVGFAGVQGAGRAALALALFGAEPFTRGAVTLAGAQVSIRSPRDAVRAGLGLLPGDRKAEAIFAMQSVRDNGMAAARAMSGLAAPDRRTGYGDIAAMDALLARLDVRAASFETEIRGLSGGNQQKCIVARWLALGPKLLIFIEPTRGIDVNAKAGIYRLMRDLARDGAAVMMISSDLPEVIGASDRILVMRDGAIVAELPRGAGEADIMHVATGDTSAMAIAMEQAS